MLAVQFFQLGQAGLVGPRSARANKNIGGNLAAAAELAARLHGRGIWPSGQQFSSPLVILK